MVGGAIAEASKTQAFKQSLERQFKKNIEEPKLGGGGGGNGSGNNNGRGGGGGGGGGDGFDHLSRNERYKLKGQFAKDCLMFTQGDKYRQECEENPIKLISDIEKVRQIMEADFCFFKPGFDAGRKSIHYYCLANALPDLSLQLGIYISDQQIEQVTNNSSPTVSSPIPDPLIYMNKDPGYILNHMTCDFDDPNINPGSEYVEALKVMNFESVFVPHYLIFREVAAVLKKDKAFMEANRVK